MMMANEAFYYNLADDSTAPVSVMGAQPALPKKLAEKKMTTKSPEEIEARFLTVATNRMKLQENIVGKAREHDAKVQHARAMKKDFDENMTLIGSTVPTDQRPKVPQGIPLPKKLQQRLANLPKAKATNELLAKENAAAAKRTSLLQARTEKIKAVHAKWGELKKTVVKTAEVEVEDVRIAALPKKLQLRLKSLPKRRGVEAIIAKESLAMLKASTETRNRAYFASQHNSAVASIFKAFKKNKTKTMPMTLSTQGSRVPQGIELPANLKQRLNTFPYGCDDNGAKIMARESRVAANRKAFLEYKRAEVQEHNMKVKMVKELKKLSVEVEKKEKETSPSMNHLPTRLRERLDTFKTSTPDEIIAKEELAVLKRMTLLRDRQRKLNEHSLLVKEKAEVAAELKQKQAQEAKVAAEVEEAKMSHLPKRLRNRLETFKKSSADDILMKEEKVHLRRKMNLENKRMTAQKFTQTRKPMGTVQMKADEPFPKKTFEIPQ